MAPYSQPIRPVLAIMVAGLIATTVCAAPTTTAEPAPQTDVPDKPLGGADAVDLSSGTDAPGSSRTLQMLLELQAAPAEAQASAPAAPRRASPKASSAAAVLTADAALPASSARRALDDESVGWNSELGGGGLGSSRGGADPAAAGYGQGVYSTAPTSRGAGGATEGSGRTFSLLPRRWIEFLRENRDWVLGGSVALLALLGVGASFNSQRRR